MTEDKKGTVFPHNFILEDRKNLCISGVSNVGSFDEDTIVAVTSCGEITVKNYQRGYFLIMSTPRYLRRHSGMVTLPSAF